MRERMRARRGARRKSRRRGRRRGREENLGPQRGPRFSSNHNIIGGLHTATEIIKKNIRSVNFHEQNFPNTKLWMYSVETY